MASRNGNGNGNGKSIHTKDIKDALDFHYGNLNAVAKKLKCSKSYIYKAMKNHGSLRRAYQRAKNRKPDAKNKKRVLLRRPPRNLGLERLISRGGRPKEISQAIRKVVFDLAKIFCTWEEIAGVTGVPQTSLRRHCREEYDQGRTKGQSSLRRHQYRSVKRGSHQMQTWLGIQELRQRKDPKDPVDEMHSQYDFDRLTRPELDTVITLLEKAEVKDA